MASKKTVRGQTEEEELCVINRLPRELIEEVFLRLPASCLLWCVGLCKKWQKGWMMSSGEPYPSEVIIFDEAWSPSTRAVPVIAPVDLVCGSCNGLLCLYTPTITIKIANPTTGETLHLQKPVKGSFTDDHYYFYRFGFHPATKEYKVLHFFHDSGTYTGGSYNVIQIYTLGDDKWKEVATPKDLSLNCVKHSGVAFVDGAVYWLNEDTGTNWQHVVMSFDLDGESFAQIQLSEVDLENDAFSSVGYYWITEIYGKVCVSTALSIGPLYRIFLGKVHVWALDEAAGQRWSQRYSSQLPLTNRGLHFVRGNKIMIQNVAESLYSYELLRNNFEIEPDKMVKLLDLSPCGEYGMHGVYGLQSYVSRKSLVSLDVYARAAIVRRPRGLKGWRCYVFMFFLANTTTFDRNTQGGLRAFPGVGDFLATYKLTDGSDLTEPARNFVSASKSPQIPA